MIKVSDLKFKYVGRKRPVFDGFNLEIEPGKIYGLLGENGTGKSTLLYLISGMLRPEAGSVEIDGVPAMERRPAMLQDVFIVPEEIFLPNISLDTYVDINSPFYPQFSTEVLYDCLHEFGFNGRIRLGELSMGQKKKVFMSFALAAGTRFLLMDEPTNGLDIPSKQLFRRVISRCMTDERTLLISTHQVHDVESLLDHLLIIGTDGLQLDASVGDITDALSFELRPSGASLSDAIYTENNVGGRAVIAPRKASDDETALNLELLFNAVAGGSLKQNTIKTKKGGNDE